MAYDHASNFFHRIYPIAPTIHFPPNPDHSSASLIFIPLRLAHVYAHYLLMESIIEKREWNGGERNGRSSPSLTDANGRSFARNTPRERERGIFISEEIEREGENGGK